MDNLRRSGESNFFSFLDRDGEIHSLNQENSIVDDRRYTMSTFGELVPTAVGAPAGSRDSSSHSSLSVSGIRGQHSQEKSNYSQYSSQPQRFEQYRPPFRQFAMNGSSAASAPTSPHRFPNYQQPLHGVPPGFIGRVNAAQPSQLQLLPQTDFDHGETVYRVQFKQKIRNHLISQNSASSVGASFRVGTYVMLETERRGMDVGMVVSTLPLTQLLHQATMAASRGDDEYGIVQTGRIVRSATQFEVQQLAPKYRDEAEVILAAQVLADEQNLPVQVLDAEYQFDRQLLTIYYSAEVRVDFRGWVRELFERYRARVWMKQLFPSPEERMRQKYEFRRAQNIQHAQAGGQPMSRMVGWNPHGYDEQSYQQQQQQYMSQEQQQQQQARNVGAEHAERPLGFCRRPNDPLDIEHDEFRFHDAADDHHYHQQQQLSQLGGLQQLGIEKQQQQQQQSQLGVRINQATELEREQSMRDSCVGIQGLGKEREQDQAQVAKGHGPGQVQVKGSFIASNTSASPTTSISASSHSASMPMFPFEHVSSGSIAGYNGRTNPQSQQQQLQQQHNQKEHEEDPIPSSYANKEIGKEPATYKGENSAYRQQFYN